VSDEAILADPPTNGDAQAVDPVEVIRQQNIAINVLRQRVIELELELLNARCELASRDTG